MRFRTMLKGFALGLTLCGLGLANAQTSNYPDRPIKIIVGFSAGSSADALARLYGQKMSDLLKVPVIVDNKPGAGGLLAVRTLRTARADGYTLHAAVGSSLAQGPATRTDLGYDPFKDLTLIGFLGTLPGAIYVGRDVPVSSVAELVAYAKANPGKLSYGSGGLGSASHLLAEYFMSLTDTKMVHVPYKSDDEAALEVATGRLQVAFTNARSILPLVSDGKVRPLAVTDARRLAQLPNVPTVGETGVKGLDALLPFSFIGLVGPAGLPDAVVARLSETINQIAAMPDVVDQMRKTLLVEPKQTTPAEFRDFTKKEFTKWQSVAKSIDLKLDR